MKLILQFMRKLTLIFYGFINNWLLLIYVCPLLKNTVIIISCHAFKQTIWSLIEFKNKSIFMVLIYYTTIKVIPFSTFIFSRDYAKIW